MNKETGGPAFPFRTSYAGMTLRDYFAAMAMQGLLANPKLQPEILKQGGAYSGWIESSAYSWADAMLKARTND
jgi:predicted aconitase